MKLFVKIVYLLLLLLSAPAASLLAEQPPVTPVDIDDDARPTVLHYYDKHGNQLEEPVRFYTTLDTVARPKSAPVYPLYNGMDIGLNFGDLIFMAFGQRYASFDLWADVSLHNWFFPVLEIGTGFAAAPEGKRGNFHFVPSLYAKAGINYNFMYKSNPDYRVYFGLRAAGASFTISNLHGTSWWGEALVGLQVKIVKRFSLGWSARWHFKFHESYPGSETPWYIPGYGGSSPFSFSASAILTI